MKARETTGTKLDAGKNRLDLVPVRAHLEFGKVLTFGAKKYGAGNWMKVIGWRWRYIGAGLRHIYEYMLGNHRDDESGFHHLAHALCCFYFVLDNELTLEAEPSLLNRAVPDGDALPPESVAPADPLTYLNVFVYDCTCGKTIVVPKNVDQSHLVCPYCTTPLNQPKSEEPKEKDQ